MCVRRNVISLHVYAYSVQILAVCILNGGLACQPKIADSTLDKEDYKKLECEISTCSNVSKIIYTKKIENQWTPVYEGVNDTCFYALDLKAQSYSLKDRTDYWPLPVKHILFITPQKFVDGGEWKCVVLNNKNETYESKAVAVDIYKQPSGNPLTIVPINSSVVTGQSAQFTCVAYLIHPKPDVVWTLNGIELADGNADNQQRDDGLWIVMNGIRMRFNNTGVHKLSCVLKTRSLNMWLMHDITLDVKEPAKISSSSEGFHINETLTLNCLGSGYKPRITWQRDGEDIPDTDSRYTITKTCDNTQCVGILKVQLLDANKNSVVYTCVISVAPPYQSTQSSHYIHVFQPNTNCQDDHMGIIVWMIIGFVWLLSTLVAFTLGIMRYQKKETRLSDAQSRRDGSSDPMVCA